MVMNRAVVLIAGIVLTLTLVWYVMPLPPPDVPPAPPAATAPVVQPVPPTQVAPTTPPTAAPATDTPKQ